METQPPTRAKLAVMAVFALSCFGLLLYLWQAFGGPVPFQPRGYRFHVGFSEATQLSQQAEVRISGVPVGKVVKTTAKDGLTDTVIELKTQYAPLPADTRAVLRQKTLLGETYVELTPGSPRARKLRDGATLSRSQVRPTVELDEILRALDPRTRRDLQRWVVSWAAALHGRGADVSDALGNLAPAAGDANDLLAVLDAQHSAVTRLVSDSGQVFSAIGSRQGAVRSLVLAGERVLSTTAARNAELADTVRILPTFLRELRPTLAVAQATAAEAAPVIRALRPAAPRLRPVLANVSALAPDARALFRELDPLISLSRTTLPALTRLVNEVSPLVDILYPLGRELVPVVDYLGAYRQELVTMFANVAADAQASFKPPGAAAPIHYLRVLIPVSNEGPVTQAHRLPTNRHNPYLRPRGLDKLATGLDSLDCANLSNPPTGLPPLGSAPTVCSVQPPFEFRGSRSAFTHLERDAP